MNRAVGLFFFVGLVGLGVLTFYVDDEANLFRQPGSEYYARFPTAAGLQKNDWVYLAGMHAGRVLNVRLDPEKGDVVVAFLLKREFKLKRDSVASLVSTSVLTSAQQLHLTAGSPEAEDLPPESFLEHVRPCPSLSDMLTSLGGAFEGFEELGPTLTDLREVLANLKTFTKKLAEGKGTLGKLVEDPKLYDDLLAAAKRVEEGMAGLRDVTAKAKEGEGTIAKLLNDPKLYDQLLSAAKRVDEGMGGLREITDKIKEGEGTLAKLLNDPKLYDDLSATMADVRKITNDIREGQGTLGKLIQDPELYNEVMGLLKSTREAVEDAREQAPVSTFTSVIFSSLL